MKVRWTEHSVRLRVTPTELGALECGERVQSSIEFNGGAWTVVVDPTAEAPALRFSGGRLLVELSPATIGDLGCEEREGIYPMLADGGPRLLVEKDFPCAHPHATEAAEPETERFAPTTSFLARRALTADCGPDVHTLSAAPPAQ